mmetsp:Transcript_5419/g.21452  ORF Transcript_5419/g.21452 Transcript_5419/m.21452 type:complete len:323 (+) Transcript_5419:1138-2106(+)|eukprot:scaffold748_cov251-Pinguiococcus_pyrenoidosus.AAC.11
MLLLVLSADFFASCFERCALALVVAVVFFCVLLPLLDALHVLDDAGQLPQGRDTVTSGSWLLHAVPLDAPVSLAEHELQLRAAPALQKLPKDWLKVLGFQEQVHVGEDVEAELRATHCNREPTDVAHVAHVLGPRQAQEYDVRLLPLESVHGLHRRRAASQVVSTAEHVEQQSLLATIRCQQGNALRRMAHGDEVEEELNRPLRLRKVLNEVWRRASLLPVHGNQLHRVPHASIRRTPHRLRQVLQPWVPPAVESGQLRPCAALCVQAEEGNLRMPQSMKHGLLQAVRSPQPRMRHDGRQLLVVAHQHDALQAVWLAQSMLL